MSRPRNRTIVLAVLFVLTLCVGILYLSNKQSVFFPESVTFSSQCYGGAQTANGEMNGAGIVCNFDECFAVNPRWHSFCSVSEGTHFCIRQAGNSTIAGETEVEYLQTTSFGNGDTWSAADNCMNKCTPGDVTFMPCNLESAAFTYNGFYWSVNAGNNIYQSYSAPNDFICPDDVRKRQCAKLDGTAYAFLPDGSPCDTDDQCYQGSDHVDDRPYPSRCIEQFTMEGTEFQCTAISTCGDGDVDANEECDDGNNDSGDGCSSQCVDEGPACGDGVVDVGEECDDGNAVNTDACTNACADAMCGDTYVRAGVEDCDDGNALNTDACLNSCDAASCGDGYVEAGEEACDDGNATNTDACRNTCVAAACGDGILRTDITNENAAGYESCDDGNTTNGDGCSSTCRTEGLAKRCGDGARNQAFEECDDGNGINTDGCTAVCKLARCGDGYIRTNVEECDPGDALLVDPAIANTPWMSLKDANVPELQKSNCLKTSCEIAQCSDGQDNDKQHGIDGADIACQAGRWGGGPALPGYNVENCPYCNVSGEWNADTQYAYDQPQIAQAAVQGVKVAASLQSVKFTASLLGNVLLAQAGGACAFDDYMQSWSCPNGQWCDTDVVTDPVTLIGTTTGGTCKACNDGGLWCESCDQSDMNNGMSTPADPTGMCDEGYRCAPAHAFPDGSWQYRCKRLSDDGEQCVTRRDCLSNYDSEGNWVDNDTACISSDMRPGGRCCPANDDSCGRSMTGGSKSPPACTMQSPTMGGGGGFNPPTGPADDPTGGWGPTWGPTQPGCKGCNNSFSSRTISFSSVSRRSSRSPSSRSGTSGSSRSSSSSRSTQQESSYSAGPRQLNYCCDADRVCRMRVGCPLNAAQCGAVCDTFESSQSSASVNTSAKSSSTSSVSSSIFCIVNSDCPGTPCINNVCLPPSSSSTSRSSGSSTSRPSSSSSHTDSSHSSSSRPVVIGSSQSSILVAGGICTGLECNQGGISFCAGQGAACETTLDFPCLICVGASSTSGRSSSSRASDGPILCTGNECAEGASQFCGLQNMTCELLDADPCFRCVAGSSSSQTSLEPITCTRRECDEGGTQFCALSGRTCGLLDADPCFVCIDEASSSEPALDVSSQDSQSSVTPMDCQSDADCSNQNRCIDGLCLNRVQIAKLPPYCGNARLDEGEQCDDGSGNSDAPNAICRENCMLARCGDRIPDTPLETCDDGNLLNGDGCSAECRLERAAPETLPAQVIQLPFTPAHTQGSVTGGSYEVVDGSSTVTGGGRPPNNAGTGPAALIIMISGAAAGFAWMRRKR